MLETWLVMAEPAIGEGTRKCAQSGLASKAGLEFWPS